MTAEVEELLAEADRLFEKPDAFSGKDKELLILRLATALRSSGSGEGWVLVPSEITAEMAHCLESNIAECLPPSEVHRANWAEAYRAMISASPKALKTGGE